MPIYSRVRFQLQDQIQIYDLNRIYIFIEYYILIFIQFVFK